MDDYIIRNRPLLLSRTSALITHTQRETERQIEIEGENSKRDRGREVSDGKYSYWMTHSSYRDGRQGETKQKQNRESFEGNLEATDVLRASEAFPN